MSSCAMLMAMSDISEMIVTDRRIYWQGAALKHESWNISLRAVFSKQSRRLNRELGLAGINKNWKEKQNNK